MAYTLIPSSNTTRNENQLRAAVDSGMVFKANLLQMSDKMAQMYLDGGAARIAQEYNLGTPEEAQEVYDLINSAAIEIRDQSPFLNQLFTRLG